MKAINLYIWLAAMLLLTSFVNAQDDAFGPLTNTDDFVQKVKTRTAATQTIQSDFRQEKHLTMLEEVLESEGHFIFKKENNVVWSYTRPLDYTIIVHNGKFIIKDGDKVKEFDIASNRMFKEINNMIVTSVSGDFLDNPDFEAVYMENEMFYLARLVPVKPEVKDMLSEIDIFFDKKDMQVAKVKFLEPGDDYTLITFSGKVFNEAVPDNVFTVSN